jgi:hypothetical protein
MMRWLNRVLPAPMFPLACLLLYGGVVLWIVVLEMQAGSSMDSSIKKRLVGLCFPGIAAYGIWRVFEFHPRLNASYCTWLKTVPWHGSQPLPFGPVHWVLQDAVIVGAAVLLSWLLAGPHAWVVVVCFAACYLAALSLSLFLTQARLWGYMTLIGVGGILYLHDSTLASALAMILAYAAGRAGLRASFRQFPWGNEQPDARPTQNKAGANTNSDSDLGWPLRQIAPRVAATKIHVPALDAVLIALVMSWLFFAMLSLGPNEGERREVSILLAQLTLFTVPAIRIGIYMFRHASPVSPRARLATGRILIPRYDVLFVPSTLAWSAGLACLWLLSLLPENAAIYVSPVIVFLAFSLCLALEPNLADWQLTGQHGLRNLREASTDIKVG